MATVKASIEISFSKRFFERQKLSGTSVFSLIKNGD